MLLKNQDSTMYGTKIYNYETKEIGLLIYTWTNEFADGDVPFATCVDSKGKRYNTAMDNITPFEDYEN
jgi:hypothetical protein